MARIRAHLPLQLACLLGITLFSAGVAAQPSKTAVTLLIMPFENHSRVAGVDWLSEACPEVLAERMASPKIYVISRDDRMFAFDKAGVPVAARPSRATIFRVAEQMGADYVVLGSYEVGDSSFRASARLLDVKNLKLGAPVAGQGPLTDFVNLQTALAWQLLRQMPNPPLTSQPQFVQTSVPIRLDAFENYVRGLIATNRQQKVHYFKEALRLNPAYTAAALELGRAYYDSHDYEQAQLCLGKVPKDDPAGGEATFLLGMTEYYRGNLERSYAAFDQLVTRIPLTEVYNNLGVVDARRGRRTAAVEYFSKAVAADPSDADYHFNYGLALFKNGDSAGAVRQLRESLQHRPEDAEAKTLLEMINRGVMPPPGPNPSTGGAAPAAQPGQPRIPIERIKRNYDEASYRQLQMEIDNLKQQRLPR